jgi:hypothetical protein
LAEYKRLEMSRHSPSVSAPLRRWRGDKHTILVRTDEPGQDFEAYTEYCFSKDGQLIHLAYELRTAWGWAFRMGGPIKDGAIHNDSSEFVNIETEKPIPKPQGADDVREALKPALFLQANRLPFYELLSR